MLIRLPPTVYDVIMCGAVASSVHCPPLASTCVYVCIGNGGRTAVAPLIERTAQVPTGRWENTQLCCGTPQAPSRQCSDGTRRPREQHGSLTVRDAHGSSSTAQLDTARLTRLNCTRLDLTRLNQTPLEQHGSTGHHLSNTAQLDTARAARLNQTPLEQHGSTRHRSSSTAQLDTARAARLNQTPLEQHGSTRHRSSSTARSGTARYDVWITGGEYPRAYHIFIDH